MVKSIFDLLTTASEMESLDGLDLEKVSSDYYHAYQKMLEYQTQIKHALPAEMQKILMELDDEYTCMRISGGDVYYRQGFSDAMRLIMQTLTWGPARS
ncbi:hypothetical protein [Pelosinus fermentans]|uniref:Uncharacterized protein n=1 Tax=Pelosinus fermentans JBW45 TaxID=1192197 RepID=I9NS07_9FIRM|nr:hypothetical protein [Pelosinus fermentans]AJQ26487.1 hypothetical protein JBW_01135 [Pelosinus fermentans JBW45]